MTTGGVRSKWQRALAALLCLVMLLTMFPWTALTAQAEAADEEAYKKELTARSEEYKEKFNLTTLLWSSNKRTDPAATKTYAESARNYLYWAEGDFGGVAYKNYIHVYAFEGDTICFGSDVYNSKLNIAGNKNVVDGSDDEKEIESKLGPNATADIVLIDLDGNRIPYDVEDKGKGHIPNVQTEVLAKTMESPGGNDAQKLQETFPELNVGEDLDAYSYTPLTYHVKETGVYTLEFHSYAYANKVGEQRYGQTTKNDEVETANNTKHNFYKPDSANKARPTEEPHDDEHCALVAAWDVSVFNEQGQKETGRVYADYLSMQMNGSYQVVESYYVVTTDSYIYRWDWNGNVPNTYNFFADNKGLTDNATGSTLYKSVKEIRNSNFDYTRFGASFKYPGSANTDEAKSYYIFFEMPDPDLEGHLYSKAIQPDPAENIRFVDTVEDPPGKQVPGAYEGMGGYFAFETKEATTATLVLDFEQLTKDDGTPAAPADGEKYAPVTISGPVKPYSTNYFYWDGRDGNGVVIPKGKYKIMDIVTLTTKAGEIHFPVHDMEYAPGGFTFTRVSPIYNRDGERVDTDDNILGKTKNVIYYDDTAIYYGEKVGSTGLTEKDVGDEGGSPLRTDPKYKDRVQQDGTGAEYYQFNNMEASKGGEYLVRQACGTYVNGVMGRENPDLPFIRIGDHSHTTNTINYYNSNGQFLPNADGQEDKINYLDSKQYPVAKIATWTSADRTNYCATTDYGIVDLWTFIPAQPAKIEDSEQVIDIIAGNAFNLTGQVFYDKNSNGTYDSMEDSDTLLSGVTLNLYKKTADGTRADDKDYFTLEQTGVKVNEQDKTTETRYVMQPYAGSDPARDGAYELYRTNETPVSGRYFFTNIPYTEGEQLVYEVVRPGASYVLTSGQTQPKVHSSLTGNGVQGGSNGSYALYAYDPKGFGTEVQVITVGTDADAGQVDPDSKPDKANTNHTVTAVDVGYHYNLTTKFKLKKAWSAGTETALPEPAVFEVRYVDRYGESHIYAEEPVTKIQNLEHTYELLPAEMDGAPVKDWYVAAEYYFAKVGSDTYLFKHTFDYDAGSGDYDSFVGGCQYWQPKDLNSDDTFDEQDIPDGNDNGKHEWLDLQDITGWQSTEGDSTVKAPFHAVLDRNVGSAETTVTITNSDKPGVIEILKYTGTLDDHNYLPGATFRLYTRDGGEEITLDDVKTLVDQNDNESTAALAKWQVGSGSTRDNGRMTFAGLDPNKHYVIREMYPPAGYRAREVLYIVHPATCADNKAPNHYHEKQPQSMDDETWETWQIQNCYFEADGHATANIANIPASGDMAIRKQIEGRAWGSTDAFTFDIAFRDNTGAKLETGSGVDLTPQNNSYGIAGSNAVRIPQAEYALYSSEVELENSLTEFLADFNNGGKDLTVNSTCDTAQDTVSVHGMQDVKVALADTRQSVPLIVNAEVESDGGGDPPTEPKPPEDALMNTSASGIGDIGEQKPTAHYFPAAGTYTFTISENPGSQPTTDYTSRVYTVVVQVTRVLDPGAESIQATLDNSYLHAEVQSMYYQDLPEGTTSTGYPENYGARAYYAGVAPTFTNRYHVQPAVQATSYAVQVDFSGRLDEDGQPINKGDITENWLENEQFTVTITGEDPATQEALRNGNIYIGGLLGKQSNLHAEKRVQFNQQNVVNGWYPDEDDKETDSVTQANEHIFKFEELDFKGIEFPVKWVFDITDSVIVDGQTYKKDDEVPPENQAEGKNLVVTFDQAEAAKHGLEAGSYFYATADVLEGEDNSTDFHKVVSRTEPLVYHLTVAMRDDGKGGITYDGCTYDMTITLKSLPGSGADGIIDEMDLVVDKRNAAGEKIDEDGNVIEDDATHYATCETDQQVVDTFDKWIDPERNFEDRPANAKYKQYYVNKAGVIREVEEQEEEGVKHYYIMDDAHNRVEVVSGRYGATGGDLKIGFQNLMDLGVTFIVKQESHSGNHTMLFENKYEATGAWTPRVTKQLNGRPWQADEEFTFTLECTGWPGKDTGEGETYKPDITKKEISIGQANAVGGEPFGTVTFHCPGTYTFTITESGGEGLDTDGSITPTAGSITLTVTAVDDNEGHLKLKATGVDGEAPEEGEINAETTVNFVNTYDEGGKFEFALSKTLTGRAWDKYESFTFTIAPGDGSETADDPTKSDIMAGKLTPSWDGAHTGEKKEVKVSGEFTQGVAGETIEGDTLTLDVGNLQEGAGEVVEQKVYHFTITEDTKLFGEKSLYCAQPEVLLTVTVTPNLSTGKHGITATYAYLVSGEAGSEHPLDGAIPFTNRYYVETAPPDTEGVGGGFAVAKAFTGRSVDGAGKPEKDAWLEDDTFTVNVAFDDASDGNPSDVFIKAPGDKDFAAIMGGTYSKQLTFTKEGHDAKEFSFRFFAEGTYVFTVSETKGNIAGVAYDPHTYTVTFMVTLNEENKLVIGRTITDGEGNPLNGGTVTIANSYTPKAAVWTPTVTKVLNGREWRTNDHFDFKLAPAEGSPTDGWSMATEENKENEENTVTVTDEEAPTASFAPVTFTEPGEYTFIISETNSELEYVTAGTYSITVTVMDDTATGELTLAFTGSDTTMFPEKTPEGGYTTGTVFVNTYSQLPGRFTLSLQKTLTGRAWQVDESFTFTVTPDEATKTAMEGDDPAIEVPEEWGSGDGNSYSFELNAEETVEGDTLTQSLGDITVNKEGAYSFTIEEKTDSGSDTWCPEPRITLTVHATPRTDGSGLPTGQMVVTTYAYAANGGSVGHNAADGTTTVPFVNYAYADTDLTLNKKYTDSTSGEEKTWSDGAFQAEIALDSAPQTVICDGAPLTVGYAVTVPLIKSGRSVALRFFAEGTYQFTVREHPGSAPGVTYDESRYTVTVTVTADSSGVLTAAAPQITKDGDEVPDNAVTFANTYKGATITGGLTVTKTVVGEGESGEFSFTVTLSGAGAGEITGDFGAMHFESGVAEFKLGHGGAVTATGLPAGGHYTVTETPTEGYTSSATGDTGIIPASGAATAAFTNTKGKEPAPPETGTGSLTVTKTVTGKEGEQEKEWSFTVTLGDKDVNGPYGEMQFSNGVAKFTLVHGHSITATGLLAGVTYTVTEAEAGQDGYETSASMDSGTIPGGGNVTAVFVNHRDEKGPIGSITVTKILAGTAAAGDSTKDWYFTIGLKKGEIPVDITGTYGDATFTNGSTAFSLRGGKTITISGLPAGLTYTVVEKTAEKDGYTITSTNATGVIEENRTAAVVFTNTKNEEPDPGRGYLTVTKTVTGNAGERDKEFDFTIALSGGIDGEHDGAYFVDGKATISLKHGESYTIELPADTAYTVTEEKTDDYTTTCTGETGKIPNGGTAVAAFANNRQVTAGSLTIRKTVSGTAGDTRRMWHFHVELGAETVNGEHGGVTFTNGKADVTLTHGQSVTFTDLPAGITYTVTEREADQDGYSTTAVGSTGRIPANDAATAAFENHKDTSPVTPPTDPGREPSPDDPGAQADESPNGAAGGMPITLPYTGDPGHPRFWLALMLLSLAALIIMAVLYLRNRRLAQYNSKRGRNR